MTLACRWCALCVPSIAGYYGVLVCNPLVKGGTAYQTRLVEMTSEARPAVGWFSRTAVIRDCASRNPNRRRLRAT